MGTLRKFGFRPLLLFLLTFHFVSFVVANSTVSASSATGSAAGYAASLDPATLSRLAGLTFKQIPEFQSMDEIAKVANLQVTAYGGTAREIADFVRERVTELGSVDAYVSWIQSRPSISIVDWHRLQSDLDIMLIPNEGAAVSLSAGRNSEIDVVRRTIDQRFPRSVFYKRIDLIVPQEFFKKYPVMGEHFEPVSNLAISSRGLEKLPQLNVDIGGRSVHLGEEGLRQFTSRKMDFRLNGTVPSEVTSKDAFPLLRQALRWIRYLSEYPDFTVSDDADKAIRQVISQLNQSAKSEVLALLTNGHKEYQPGQPSFSEGARIIEQLEKLQLYSRNSVRTRQLLETYGVEQMAREAGIDRARIFKPIKPREVAENVTGQKLGKEVVVRHRTTLNAAQNISRGALWASDDRAILGSKGVSTAALGQGLYAAPDFKSIGYGDHFVSITLSADAVEGVDFRRKDDWYVIITENAIAKDKNGIRKINRVSQKEILDSLVQTLDSDGISTDDRRSILRGISGLLNPENSKDDFATLRHVFSEAKSRGIEDDLATALLSRPHLHLHLGDPASPFRQWVVSEVGRSIDVSRLWTETARINAAELMIPSSMSEPTAIHRLPSKAKDDFLDLTKSLPPATRERYLQRIKLLEADPDPVIRLSRLYWTDFVERLDDGADEEASKILSEIEKPSAAVLSRALKMVDNSKDHRPLMAAYLLKHIGVIQDPDARMRIQLRNGVVPSDLDIDIKDYRTFLRFKQNVQMTVNSLGSNPSSKVIRSLIDSGNPGRQKYAMTLAAAASDFASVDFSKLQASVDFSELNIETVKTLMTHLQENDPGSIVGLAPRINRLRGLKLSDDTLTANTIRRELTKTLVFGGAEALQTIAEVDGDSIPFLINELSERSVRDLPTEKLLIEWLAKAKDPRVQTALLGYFWKASVTAGPLKASRSDDLFALAKVLAVNSESDDVRKNAFDVLAWNFRDRPETLALAASRARVEPHWQVTQSIYGALQASVREKPYGTYDYELAVNGFKSLAENPSGIPRNAKYMLDELEYEKTRALSKPPNWLTSVDSGPAPIAVKAPTPVSLSKSPPIIDTKPVIPPDAATLSKPEPPKGLRRFLPECAKWFEKLRKS